MTVSAEGGKQKMTKVLNQFGAEVNFEAAVEYMDNSLRENLHMDMVPCTEQEFFTAYCKAHRERFNEAFFLDESNPVY